MPGSAAPGGTRTCPDPPLQSSSLHSLPGSYIASTDASSHRHMPALSTQTTFSVPPRLRLFMGAPAHEADPRSINAERRATRPSAPSLAPLTTCTSAAVPLRPPHSNRATPLSPTTLAAPGAMAAPGFSSTSQSQSLRSAPLTHSSFTPAMTVPVGMPPMSLDTMKPIGTPYTNSPAPPIRVLIRRLPLDTTKESLRLMLLWSEDLAGYEVIPADSSRDDGFCSAIVKFKTMKAAVEAKNKLGGRSNASDNGEMIVEILPTSPTGTSSHAVDRSPTSPSATVSPTATTNSTSSNPSSGPRSYVSGAIDSVLGSRSNNIYQRHGQSVQPEASFTDGYDGTFSPTSPIGNQFHDRTRVSGKSLIENNLTDDDETSDLLRNPLAFAENGAAPGSSHGRRATAPQIPLTQLSQLSLNTNTTPSSASVPSPYGVPMSAHVNGATPFNSGTNGMGHDVGHSYQGNNNHSHYRSHFPPINPADQNPPCNTLYVGNLPVETSEEELKAVFSKQRGYKRLCFRTKHNGPMCFVEFEDITFATKALHELYGVVLTNSIKGGIRLSFSKNPLGVRSQHNSGSHHSSAMGGLNGTVNGSANGFTTASGPPPGLSAPPGLAQSHVNYNAAATNGNHGYNQNGFAGGSNYSWSGVTPSNYGAPNGLNGVNAGNGLHGPNGINGANGTPNGNGVHNSRGAFHSNGTSRLPPHMMGR